MSSKQDHVQKNDLISIIVPVYKVEKYLDQCVESLVNQTYTNIEIILVDDGSPDNCPKMCDDWAVKDKRIKVIHKENGGQQTACCEGVKQCKGKYVCFLDSDDYAERSMISELYTALINNKAEVCFCDFWFTYDSHEDGMSQYEESKLFVADGGNLYHLLNKIHPCRWNKIYVKSLIEKSFDYCDKSILMGEDLNQAFYVFSTANKIYYLKKQLIHYRQLDNSMAHKKRDRWPDYKNLIVALLKIGQDKELHCKDFIYKAFLYPYIKLSIAYYVTNKEISNLNNLLNEDILLDFNKTFKPDNWKQRLFLYCLKHKRVKLLKLLLKK